MLRNFRPPRAIISTSPQRSRSIPAETWGLRPTDWAICHVNHFLQDKLKTAEETSAAVLGGQVNKLGLEVVAQDTEASHVEDDPFGDWGMANVGVSDAKEESDGGVSQQSSDGDGYNVTIVQLLAERDNLLRFVIFLSRNRARVFV